MVAGPFGSNSDRPNGTNPSTATVPTSKSAAAPTRYSNDMSRLRVKLRRAATASRRKISISMQSTISASPARAATAASSGLRPSRPRRLMPPLATLSRDHERRTWSARSPAGETIGPASFNNLPGTSSGGTVKRTLALGHPARPVGVTYWQSKIRRPLQEPAFAAYFVPRLGNDRCRRTLSHPAPWSWASTVAPQPPSPPGPDDREVGYRSRRMRRVLRR